MSVTEVQARIGQIESYLATLDGRVASLASGRAAGASATSSASATPFATQLADAQAAGSSGDGQAVVDTAKKYLGVPYVWGGTDPAKGLDCSGLVQQVYGELGYDLPRVSRDQAKVGTAVPSLDQARPGDLLAFNSPVTHIGIYVGDGKMIHAPKPGEKVRIEDVYDTPTAIRRVIGAESATSGSSAPAAAGSYGVLFERAEARYGVDAGLLAAVAKQESGFDATAVSPAGAQGLMQLMPATARGLGVTDAFDPAQAVDGAARLLRDLTQRFGSTELALAAYNAGPGAVMRYDGVPPYAETRHYVRSIMADLEGAR
ncbi:transglycosylase SLT domain-containing protein [Aeromicrobium sp. IC_218]|uniref:transglycosylase SLT domain-containing protein n=1 Tax=Aeromicrobium sp. IC_218 TaxID=2545468 RepID=UPI0010396BEC|nr:transglycosylase SLT domain-containing protein [Aeromicrobium sp. IC_218]TCJ00523.1 lytic transglycosylase [Aeromicrobium sp. IC_218]